MTTDPIADMLTRIRNGIAVGKTEILVPHSNAKEKVAQILTTNGFLADAKTIDVDESKALQITIAREGQPATITEISRLSRPGRRVYVKADDIPVVKRGRGIVVVSTSQGIMVGKQAYEKRLGGELICKVY